MRKVGFSKKYKTCNNLRRSSRLSQQLIVKSAHYYYIASKLSDAF